MTDGLDDAGDASGPIAQPEAAAPAEPKASNAGVGGRLFRSDYSGLTAGLRVQPTWWREQEPTDRTGTVQEDRIRAVAAAPGLDDDPARPTTAVMRVELRPYDDPTTPAPADGDVTDTGGFKANRAEVFDRIATRGTPAAKWPDPVESVRWYSFSLYVPVGFQTDPKKWFTLTQWKGLDGGGPPVALELDGSSLVLGGKFSRRDLGPIVPGRWTRIVVGLKLSPDPALGWVIVVRDGVTRVARLPGRTMETLTSAGISRVDPIYLKQGIYRSAAWTVTQVLFFGPTTIGATPESVQ